MEVSGHFKLMVDKEFAVVNKMKVVYLWIFLLFSR